MNSTTIPTLYYPYQHKLPIDLSQVVRLEGTGNYTGFILADGTSYLSSKSLCVYEKHLPACFLRVHKSCIVNRRFIGKFDKLQLHILMTDGSKIKVARRRKCKLENWLSATDYQFINSINK
ncbi:MAG: LytTR family DNA-binding domain-containing protein [Spirosomataceae bacterium]